MASDAKSPEEKPTEETKPDPSEKPEESSEKEATKSEGEGEDKPSSMKGKKREKKEAAPPATPTIERPTRERKVVERYTESSLARSSSPKPLSFEKGRGTPLRDIPNVAFLLSKKKPDDNLQMLHTILFGRKSKANMLKRNLGMFSGFVWTQSEEEKQRGKLKEKLDKCVKDKLFYFCDVLNIPANKTSSKKEELSAKLLEFLESPHATTDILLADKEKKGKRKMEKASARRTSGSSGKSAKKQKNSSAGEKRKHSSKSDDEEVDDTIEHSDGKEVSSEDEMSDMVAKAESDQEQNSSDEDGEEHEEPKKLKHSEISYSKKSIKKESGVHVKEKFKAVEKDAPVESPKSSTKDKKRSSSSKPLKVSSASKSPKKQKVEKDSGKAEDEANEKAKSSAKLLKSDRGKGKSDKQTKEEPSREEMHEVVVSILKKVDFNTATLSDILRQLGDHFGVDLMHRKAEVKAIITEAINNMTDDEDEEDENAEGGSDHAKDEDNGEA